MTTYSRWFNSFNEAWEMLIDVPLPAFFKENIDDEENDSSTLLACFPVVGAVVGLGLYAVAWVIALLLPVHTAAAVVGAVCLALITESISIGGNTSTLAMFICAGKKEVYGSELAMTLENENVWRNPMEQIFFLSLYLLKLFCIALLFLYDRTSWLVIVYTMSYLVRSQMATWNSLETSLPMIGSGDEDASSSLKMPWIVALCISFFIAGFNYFPAVIIAGLIAYFMLRYFKKITEKKIGGVTGSLISTAGIAAELIFFVLGLILLRD